MKSSQIAALAVVLVLIGGLIVAKAMRAPTPSPEPAAPPVLAETSPPPTTAGAESPAAQAPEASAAPTEEALPQLLELGSVGCKPCEYMAPIIAELEKELAGQVSVMFHDVINDEPALAEKYQIATIPTQVFVNSEGKELFRHIGVFEKEEILAKLKELGMLKE